MMRRILSSVLDAMGITSLQWQRRPAGVYCFNLHRVGNDDGIAFHPNLFSCTGARFGELVAFLKGEFEMIGIDRLTEMIDAGATPDRRYGMITFDDGYIDNYTVAYPVLARAGCPAGFFLPTDFVDGTEVPWWDRIAWCVHHLGDGQLRVPGGEAPVVIQKSDLAGSIRRVLRVVKDTPAIPMDEKVRAIEGQVACPDIHAESGRIFMNWAQAREMRSGGMWFGSHTRSHRILSHLTEEDQCIELAESKRAVEAGLGEPITALAYPVGGPQSYSQATVRIARECGYRAAFTFIAGVNVEPAAHPFELKRMAIDDNPDARSLRRLVISAPA
jgi:peptidoglycan/xylan/chitin deacetylase (PgdA/CDA1 family)